ncbi:WD40-repeat-containing domain protein [Armillaria luteobubalina]|uniref:WD40-repeat-containing domain protein n=1 Tax=Armillaria luteobubalina TaxID=153913 RepID=A0AA39Q6C8_9AGAR|nr:WD40-repeat-containing domain protein [Armillaria luteobubalina]
MDNSEVCHPFSDLISSICFSPKHNYLAAGSLDRTVAIYAAHSLSDSKLETTYHHQGPVLSVCWSQDGSKILSSGADNVALVLDAESGCMSLFAQHEKPVKAVRLFENSHQNIFVMGSWDKTVKVWDARTEGLVATISIPEQCYALDVRYGFPTTSDIWFEVPNIIAEGLLLQLAYGHKLMDAKDDHYLTEFPTSISCLLYIWTWFCYPNPGHLQNLNLGSDGIISFWDQHSWIPLGAGQSDPSILKA